MNIRRFSLALTGLLGMELAFGQPDNMDEVRFFTNFFEDAARAQSLYAEGVFSFSDFDRAERITLGGRGGLPVATRAEIGGELRYLDIDPDNGDGESGLSDLLFVGRYHFDLNTSPTQFTGGALFTLPTGDEDLGEDNFDFGVFGAVRHPLSNDLVVAGTVGFNFIEVPDVDDDDDREFSLLLGGGAIYEVNNKLHVLGEFQVRTEEDFGIFDGGVDYEVTPNGRLRGAFGLGFDDNGPDFALLGGFLYSFGGVSL